MKPKRPDSAKSQLTKKTLDSQNKDLTASKFSETFTSGVTNHQSPNFQAYVAEKNKDPRFAQFQKTKLNQIKEEPKPLKPFSKNKVVKVKPEPKVEEPRVKEEEGMSQSRGFAERSKLKMNTLKIPQKGEKSKREEQKPIITFEGFTVNVPGMNREKVEKVEKGETVGKAAQSKEQLQKARKMRQISDFLEQVETRNECNFPANYEQFVSQSECSELDKIDIREFLNEPTEEDYKRVEQRIRSNDNRLDESISSSMLEDQINGEEEEVFLSGITSEQLKERNVFLTELLKGKVTQKQLSKLQVIDRSAMKLKKIQGGDSDVEEIALPRNRLIERNRVEAIGDIYRDCDYLSDEHKRRLQQLLEGNEGIQSPFQQDQLEQMRNRRIDEGIRMYQSRGGQTVTTEPLIYEESLPKDPALRQEAEKKILKDKVQSVNQRLMAVDKVVVNKTKISNLLKECEGTRVSEMGQELLKDNARRFEEETQKIKEAEGIIKNSLAEKESVEQTLREIDGRFRQLEEEVKKVRRMSQRQIRDAQVMELRDKLKRVGALEQLVEKSQRQMKELQQHFQRELGDRVRVLDQFQGLRVQMGKYEVIEGETVEDIDAAITLRLQRDG